MIELCISRLHTPDFEFWARRDGVLLRVIALVAKRLRHTLLLKMVALDVDGMKTMVASYRDSVLRVDVHVYVRWSSLRGCPLSSVGRTCLFVRLLSVL